MQVSNPPVTFDQAQEQIRNLATDDGQVSVEDRAAIAALLSDPAATFEPGAKELLQEALTQVPAGGLKGLPRADGFAVNLRAGSAQQSFVRDVLEARNPNVTAESLGLTGPAGLAKAELAAEVIASDPQLGRLIASVYQLPVGVADGRTSDSFTVMGDNNNFTAVHWRPDDGTGKPGFTIPGMYARFDGDTGVYSLDENRQRQAEFDTNTGRLTTFYPVTGTSGGEGAAAGAHHLPVESLVVGLSSLEGDQRELALGQLSVQMASSTVVDRLLGPEDLPSDVRLLQASGGRIPEGWSAARTEAALMNAPNLPLQARVSLLTQLGHDADGVNAFLEHQQGKFRTAVNDEARSVWQSFGQQGPIPDLLWIGVGDGSNSQGLGGEPGRGLGLFNYNLPLSFETQRADDGRVAVQIQTGGDTGSDHNAVTYRPSGNPVNLQLSGFGAEKGANANIRVTIGGESHVFNYAGGANGRSTISLPIGGRGGVYQADGVTMTVDQQTGAISIDQGDNAAPITVEVMGRYGNEMTIAAVVTGAVRQLPTVIDTQLEDQFETNSAAVKQGAKLDISDEQGEALRNFVGQMVRSGNPITFEAALTGNGVGHREGDAIVDGSSARQTGDRQELRVTDLSLSFDPRDGTMTIDIDAFTDGRSTTAFGGNDNLSGMRAMSTLRELMKILVADYGMPQAWAQTALSNAVVDVPNGSGQITYNEFVEQTGIGKKQ